MHDPDSSEDQDACEPRIRPGELDSLLREIEREAVPARLLALALELEAALVQSKELPV